MELAENQIDVLTLARYLEDSFGDLKGRYSRDHDFRFWLQKTLYYIQCYALIKEGYPLFAENIISFPKGPIIEGLHEKLKETPPSNRIDCLPFLYVDIIAHVLRQYSGDHLSTISHSSLPWNSVDNHSKITIENIKENFGKCQFEREFLEDVAKAVEEAKQREQTMNERFEKMSFNPNNKVTVQY